MSRRRSIKLAFGLLTACLASGLNVAQAATVTITVSPLSGVKTASLTARASVSSTCAGQAPSYLFTFSWDVTIQVLHTATVACNRKAGGYVSSYKFVPPAAHNTIGVHTVGVVVMDQVGGRIGSNGAGYIISAAPPRPSPTLLPIPAPSHRPSPRPSPSLPPAPTPSACARAAGALGPGTPGARGGGEPAVVVAVLVIGTIGAGGLAMVFSPMFAARRRELNRPAAIIGLTAASLMLLTGCTPPFEAARATPSQAAASPSASPTPTC